ncbi:MAG: NAD+ synthase, partial [Cyanobacteria bacterium J06641_5]
LLRENLQIGVTICEDLWNDEQFWRDRSYEVNPLDDLAKSNVDLIVNLSASPYSAGKQELREAMLAHSANRYRLPILYANQVGGNDDLLFDGSSVVFDRDGSIISRACAFTTDLISVNFDFSKGDLLPALVVDSSPCLEAEIWSALVMGVRDYAAKCGFKQALLGLSGGIDSSLVAAIAAEALGAENVLGLLMPSPYSSEGSIADAAALVQHLGMSSTQIPIQPAMSTYDTMLEPLFAGTEFGVAEENIQSRTRGILLMAVANKFNYLLLSTGNKSEMAVGYCTLYGDMNGGLAVISDVPKTLVYRLCRWCNRDREIIPENVLLKPPSAELKPDQKDSDSLPSYEVLDDILERFIRQHQGSAEIIAAGHTPDVVARVLKLVARAEFKRRQAPPGLKISDRAFGTGWRMPIASRMTNF